MKTMTFSGRTMREAIAQAKARFGGDVDILDSDAVGFGQHQRTGRLWSYGRQWHR